jgi:hypothetical protein
MFLALGGLFLNNYACFFHDFFYISGILKNYYSLKTFLPCTIILDFYGLGRLNTLPVGVMREMILSSHAGFW